MNFQPDYRQTEKVLHNERPERLPLYEHHIDAPFISKVLGEELSSEGLNKGELKGYYRKVIGFWKDMTYDAFDFEAAICDNLPGHGAIMGAWQDQYKHVKILIIIHGKIFRKFSGKLIFRISKR